MKTYYFLICLFLAIITLCIPIIALEDYPTNVINNNIPSEVIKENTPSFNLEYEIEIENTPNGVIKKIMNAQEFLIGEVLRPAKKLKIMDHFWAGHYLKACPGQSISTISAVGVNAIHIRVGDNAESYNPEYPEVWYPKILDIGIKELFIKAGTNFDNAVIYTNLPGGEGLFGGDSTPYPGNPVYYLNDANEWVPLENRFIENYDKTIPLKIRIKVYSAYTDQGRPDYMEFENWANGDEINGNTMFKNGKVLLHYQNQEPRYIADVIQRVKKTGRFIGSEYAKIGSIRAAHGGVICLSTSQKYGGISKNQNHLRGGFQIIPANHAKYLYYNKVNSFSFNPQYMIIAHTNADNSILKNNKYIINISENNEIEKMALSYNPIFEGVAPLFALYLKPSPENYFIISKDFGLTWEPCPNIHGIADIPNSWTNIRIYLK
ncbi:MAG: hypothetical protein WC860_08045 [Candidatus Margulisiibacteriota bacterium]|jgi:hypothetical protein